MTETVIHVAYNSHIDLPTLRAKLAVHFDPSTFYIDHVWSEDELYPYGEAIKFAQDTARRAAAESGAAVSLAVIAANYETVARPGMLARYELAAPVVKGQLRIHSLLNPKTLRQAAAAETKLKYPNEAFFAREATAKLVFETLLAKKRLTRTL